MTVVSEQPKRTLALLIPAHNEQLVLGDTITSALRAGLSRQDIYVVSDGSTDWTVDLAYLLLPDGHVLDQPQMGKGMALANGILNFRLIDRYEWVHIADADGLFTRTYFRELKSRLSRKYVAATGHVQSLKGGWIAKYRTYEYTLGLEVMRRIQAAMGTIPVMPGATTILRTDIIPQLDFSHPSLTEDMDMTMQIHRRRLGRIGYVPQAKAFTQDPKDFGDYYRQVLRWYRGGWQVMTRHRIGRRFRRIDAYMGWMVMEEFILLLEVTIFPLWSWWGTNYVPLALMFLVDLTIVFATTVWAAMVNNRPDIIGAFPLYYILRFVNLFAFFKAWFEIVVQRKFRTTAPGWSTAGRRYRIAPEVVSSK
jgi:biofilm PGA synthesis N-glycosyltransferase PgaC